MQGLQRGAGKTQLGERTIDLLQRGHEAIPSKGVERDDGQRAGETAALRHEVEHDQQHAAKGDGLERKTRQLADDLGAGLMASIGLRGVGKALDVGVFQPAHFHFLGRAKGFAHGGEALLIGLHALAAHARK